MASKLGDPSPPGGMGGLEWSESCYFLDRWHSLPHLRFLKTRCHFKDESNNANAYAKKFMFVFCSKYYSTVLMLLAAYCFYILLHLNVIRTYRY